MVALFLADSYGRSSFCSYDSTNDFSLAKPAIVLMLEKASLDICKGGKWYDSNSFSGREREGEREGGFKFSLVFHYLTCFLHGFSVFIFKASQHFGLEHAREPDERQEAHDNQG